MAISELTYTLPFITSRITTINSEAAKSFPNKLRLRVHGFSPCRGLRVRQELDLLATRGEPSQVSETLPASHVGRVANLRPIVNRPARDALSICEWVSGGPVFGICQVRHGLKARATGQAFVQLQVVCPAMKFISTTTSGPHIKLAIRGDLTNKERPIHLAANRGIVHNRRHDA
jgi:hypothetical protein